MATNIDFFNRFTVLLLDHLYENFPCPVEVRPYDLAITLEPDDVDEATAMQDMEIGFHAMSWLEEECYIRYDGAESLDRDSGYLGVRLTEQGIMLLSKELDAASGETVASRFKDLVRAGLATAAKETVKQAVNVMFRTMM